LIVLGTLIIEKNIVNEINKENNPSLRAPLRWGVAIPFEIATLPLAMTKKKLV
jgi:hypothetical protein